MDQKQEQLIPLRHSAEHVLHQAMVELFPGLKRAMGPATADGFYLDFDYDGKVSEEDFPKIEKRMQEIIDADLPIIKEEVSIEDARKMFEGNEYKQEWIDQIENEGNQATVYWNGQTEDPKSDVDLCKGPHVESTGKIGAFKLLSVAGAYWHGDEKNKMLTRIYGTAFESQAELDEYLTMLEEAKKRDHKKLGKELDLYFMDSDVGMGLPLWTPKGTTIKLELEKFTRELEKKYGYQHVFTPYLGGEELYQTSGHLDHYKDNMYQPIDMDGDLFYLRPMSCPHHIKMYMHQQRSYRELPVRYAEIADYNRFEKSGELMGLIRVRKFQLTDGHVLVAPDQLEDEFKHTCKMIQEAMTVLGIIDKVTYRFSKHDPLDKEKYFPDQELWAKAENLMQKVLDEQGLNYYEGIGEAAFYGPKLDVQIKNVNGKEDTIITAQIDFLLPEKFKIEYIDADGQIRQPVMIHRSTIGCLERTFAFLIEHYAGAFPVWLSPTQVSIIPITDRHNEYAQKVLEQLLSSNIRAESDTRSEKMQAKIRDAQMQKIPYMLIMGDREQESGTVAVRTRDGQDLGAIKIEEFIARVKDQIESRS